MFHITGRLHSNVVIQNCNVKTSNKVDMNIQWIYHEYGEEIKYDNIRHPVEVLQYTYFVFYYFDVQTETSIDN